MAVVPPLARANEVCVRSARTFDLGSAIAQLSDLFCSPARAAQTRAPLVGGPDRGCGCGYYLCHVKSLAEPLQPFAMSRRLQATGPPPSGRMIVSHVSARVPAHLPKSRQCLPEKKWPHLCSVEHRICAWWEVGQPPVATSRTHDSRALCVGSGNRMFLFFSRSNRQAVACLSPCFASGGTQRALAMPTTPAKVPELTCRLPRLSCPGV